MMTRLNILSVLIQKYSCFNSFLLRFNSCTVVFVSTDFVSTVISSLQVLERNILKSLFHLSVLAGQEELVLASLNGEVQGARIHLFPATTPNCRALPDWSGRTERL